MAVNIPVISKPRIVIVGGGFAGIELAKSLRKINAQIVLIDKNNYHTFQPLLYQVATAGLEPDSIAYPFREIFQSQPNVLFRMTEVVAVKIEERVLSTTIGDIPYDYLVLALGSKTNYYNLLGVEENAHPMKSISQAVALRNRILENFEKALLADEVEERQRLMNIVVIGGGPTGVETAGALGELRRHILPHDYPELDFHQMHIHIIDMEDRLLCSMSPAASVCAERFLTKMGVNIWLKTKVVSYNGAGIRLSNDKTILSDTVIWAAGVKANLIEGLPSDAVTGSGRLKVDEYNQVSGCERVFAVGDMAAIVTGKNPQEHPMLAPVAIQQAKHLGKNLSRVLAGRPLVPFFYRDPGLMTTIGRNQAVVDLGWLKFQGGLAWFVWVFVHLMVLIGFRNKLVVMVNWAWNYFSYDRGLRLIIRPFQKGKHESV